MYGVDAIKSVILTLAAAERVISIQEAAKLSRLEEDFQVSISDYSPFAYEIYFQTFNIIFCYRLPTGVP